MSIIDHLLSTVVLIIFLIEFLLVLIASWRVWGVLRSRWLKVLVISSNVVMWMVYFSFYF